MLSTEFFLALREKTRKYLLGFIRAIGSNPYPLCFYPATVKNCLGLGLRTPIRFATFYKVRVRFRAICNIWSAREARSYTWCDQRFVSVNIASHEPARIIVILEDFACWTLFFYIFDRCPREWIAFFVHV